MNLTRIPSLALLLFVTLIFSGCCLIRHHGHNRCSSPCEVTAGQKNCQPPQNGLEANCDKPCCDKMKGAGTPAE